MSSARRCSTPWRASGIDGGRSPCASPTGPACAGENSWRCKATTSSSNRPGSCTCVGPSNNPPGDRPGSRHRNGKVRTTIFPKSLVDDLAEIVDAVVGREGPEGLLFTSASGRIMRRSNVQPVWIRAADAARWPMTAPLQRTAGHGQTNKGWRWTGAARGESM